MKYLIGSAATLEGLSKMIFDEWGITIHIGVGKVDAGPIVGNVELKRGRYFFNLEMRIQK